MTDQVAPEVKNCIMSDEAAPCWAIVTILLTALAGIAVSLWYISSHWSSATGPERDSIARLQVIEDLAKDDYKTAHLAWQAADVKAKADPKDADAQKAANEARKEEEKASIYLQQAQRNLAPDPMEVLLMTAILGALGGLIHLSTSFVTYVGNRQLLRSWIPYYIVAPFLGASLAPVVYLLLSNSVVQPVSGMGINTGNLNLPGLYAIAALTGMFARAAAEKLADVFALVFSKVDSRDKLQESTKPPGAGGPGGDTPANGNPANSNPANDAPPNGSPGGGAQ